MSSFVSELLSVTTPVALSQNSGVARVERIAMGDITAVITGANQANQTFTADASTDTGTTATAHGYTTGVLVTLTTTTLLPAGLSLATNYYLIVTGASTVKFASSQANAAAGTAIDVTSAGTGVHTINVTAALAGSVKLQKTNWDPNDPGTAWVDLDDLEVDNGNNSQTFTAAATKNWALWNMGFAALRVVVTTTSGTVTCRVRMTGKSQN